MYASGWLHTYSFYSIPWQGSNSQLLSSNILATSPGHYTHWYSFLRIVLLRFAVVPKSRVQGCQMGFFKPKIPIWVNFGMPYIPVMPVDWKMLIYFMAICNILRTFDKYYGHLVLFVFIWYIFPVLVLRRYQEKSGNPGRVSSSFKVGLFSECVCIARLPAIHLPIGFPVTELISFCLPNFSRSRAVKKREGERDRFRKQANFPD
jgi:hypothetical protein